MTSYFALCAGTDLAIRAVTYEIRITQVNLFAFTGGGEVVQALRHEGSTLSGGTAADLVPLHEGAPAASATAMTGSPLTFSGTSKIVGSAYVPPGATFSIVATTVITSYPGSQAQIVSPLTLTVSPGSVFHVLGPTAGTVVQVHFEELRLPGSY